MELNNRSYLQSAEPTDQQRRLRRWFVWGVIALLVVGLGIQFLVSYLTMGSVSITTADSSSSISLENKANPAVSYQGRGKLSKHVHTGTYIVTVSGSSQATNEIVVVKAHQSQHLDVTIATTTGVEPVSDITAQNIIGGTSALYFVNSDGHLSMINADNTSQVVNTNIVLRTVRWASSDHGVGQSNTGDLYRIDNGKITPLGITISNPHNNYPIYTVAPSGQAYVAIGTRVYSVSTTNTFTLLYTAATDPTALVANGGNLLVINNPDNAGDNSNGTGRKASLHLLLANGHTVDATGGTFFAAVSPDGKYIAATRSKGVEILDDNLKTVAAIPTTSVRNPVWSDNATLLYSLSDQLWSYNVHSQRSQLIANMPFGGSISELSLSDDHTYLYMGVMHLDNAPVIKRLSLTKQPLAPVLSQLQSIMPLSGNGYSVSLTNFTRPVLMVTPSYPLTDTNDQYLAAASDQLKASGIDLSQVQLQLAQ